MTTINDLPKIIGFSGKIGSGKTTLTEFLCNKFPYAKVSFADPLKFIVQYLYSLDYDQLYGNKKEVIDPRYGVTPRYLLQYIGTNLFRNWDTDFWVKVFKRKYLSMDYIILDDVRFENEAAIIHEMGGIIIKVVSHRNVNNSSSANHASEQGIKNYDYKIYNDQGYDELHCALQELLHYIKTNNCNNDKDDHTD